MSHNARPRITIESPSYPRLSALAMAAALVACTSEGEMEQAETGGTTGSSTLHSMPRGGPSDGSGGHGVVRSTLANSSETAPQDTLPSSSNGGTSAVNSSANGGTSAVKSSSQGGATYESTSDQTPSLGGMGQLAGGMVAPFGGQPGTSIDAVGGGGGADEGGERGGSRASSAGGHPGAGGSIPSGGGTAAPPFSHSSSAPER